MQRFKVIARLAHTHTHTHTQTGQPSSPGQAGTDRQTGQSASQPASQQTSPGQAGTHTDRPTSPGQYTRTDRPASRPRLL
jgi:hypothetical protein